MDTLKLALVICGLGLASATTYDIRLGTPEGEAVNGSPYTLSCSVNKSIPVPNVIWNRAGDNVLASTVTGFDKPLGDLKSPYGEIWGRYFVTLYGPYEHHLTLLIDSNKDEGSTWRCLTAGYESNAVTIQTRQPPPPSFWTMEWIFGLVSGITGAVLILSLPVYVRCRPSR